MIDLLVLYMVFKSFRTEVRPGFGRSCFHLLTAFSTTKHEILRRLDGSVTNASICSQIERGG